MPLTRIEPLVGVSRFRDRAKQRGLAAARRSDEGDELAPRDLEIDVAQGRDRPPPPYFTSAVDFALGFEAGENEAHEEVRSTSRFMRDQRPRRMFVRITSNFLFNFLKTRPQLGIRFSDDLSFREYSEFSTRLGLRLLL
jgi:hypothetical protein